MKKKKINHRGKTQEPQPEFGRMFTQQQQSQSKWKAVMLHRDQKVWQKHVEMENPETKQKIVDTVKQI
jgi:hypothetical protein